MKKTSLFLSVILIVALLTSCGANTESILEKYSDCTAVNPDENKSGISINQVFWFRDEHTVDVWFSIPLLYDNTNNAHMMRDKIKVYNAENLDAQVKYEVVTQVINSKNSNTSEDKYFPHIMISEEEKARYIIIYFSGIDDDENPEWSTPPLFYIAELNKDKSQLLTTTPLLANDKFN